MTSVLNGSAPPSEPAPGHFPAITPRPRRALTATERCCIELIKDHARPDPVIALAAGASLPVMAWSRRFMEKSGGIPRWVTGMPAINSAKQRCKRGHELAGGNLAMIPGRGGRLFRCCVTCRRARQRAYQRTRRALRRAQDAA